MCQSALLLLVVILSTASTLLAEITARANTCCGLMSGKVYCYGGLSFTSPTDAKADTALLSLDISTKSGVHTDELQDMWELELYDTNGVQLSPRTDPQCLVVTEQNRMIVNGGYDATVGHRLENINTMYDAAQRKWIPTIDYSETYWGYRQIYYGSASYVPGKGAAFYGGYEEYINTNWGLGATNASAFAFGDNSARTIGYQSVTYFDANIKSADAWHTPTPLTDAYDQFSAKHQSVFDPFTNLLLFMGGEYRINRQRGSTDALLRPYNHIKAFNTETNVWNYMNLTGDVPAPGRLYSTLTLLPSTNQHVLLFGGELNDNVLSDYCFILNLYNKTWTKQTINAPNGTILARSRHSAVSIDRNTVLIMWGIDSNNVGTRSMLILDTTDPYAIKLSSIYTASDDKLRPFVVQVISDGVKAGIAIAGAAALALVALSIWFCMNRKKKKRKMKEQERDIVKQQQESEYYNRTDVESMEVDWDEIDNKCTEMSAGDAAYKKDDSGHVLSDETTAALVSRIETPSATATVLLPDGIEAHQPNTLDSPRPPTVIKPDGGH